MAAVVYALLKWLFSSVHYSFLHSIPWVKMWPQNWVGHLWFIDVFSWCFRLNCQTLNLRFQFVTNRLFSGQLCYDNKWSFVPKWLSLCMCPTISWANMFCSISHLVTTWTQIWLTANTCYTTNTLRRGAIAQEKSSRTLEEPHTNTTEWSSAKRCCC